MKKKYSKSQKKQQKDRKKNRIFINKLKFLVRFLIHQKISQVRPQQNIHLERSMKVIMLMAFAKEAEFMLILMETNMKVNG